MNNVRASFELLAQRMCLKTLAFTQKVMKQQKTFGFVWTWGRRCEK